MSEKGLQTQWVQREQRPQGGAPAPGRSTFRRPRPRPTPRWLGRGGGPWGMESPPRRPPAGTLARLGQGCSPGGRGRPRGAGVPLPAEGKYLQSRDRSSVRRVTHFLRSGHTGLQGTGTISHTTAACESSSCSTPSTALVLVSLLLEILF